MITNDEAKQAAIIKAWAAEGVNFSPLAEPALSADGYMFTKDSFDRELFDYDYNQCLENEVRIRPRSLQGVEYNNGFTRIEPGGSNLPKPGQDLYETVENGVVFHGLRTADHILSEVYYQDKNHITHFKKWEPSKGPVY